MDAGRVVKVGTSPPDQPETRAKTAPVKRYRNCRVLSGHGTLEDGDIWVRDGRIIDPMLLFYTERRFPDEVIDCNGLIASPGFIDIQVNGAFEKDFSSFSSPAEVEEGLKTVSKKLLRYGVTAFCPTLVTSSTSYYNKILPHIMKSEGGKHGAAILGVHVEGPFINKEKKGAHKIDHIKDSSISIEEISATYGSSLDNIRIITLAPEIPGCMETLPWLRENNVVVSLGHSMADLRTAEEAVNNGASLITHLFNAMLPFHHRDPGIVGLLTSLNINKTQIYYGLIADGYHTDTTVQRIAQKSNPEGVVLVTDSIAAMGVTSGQYKLGEMTVDIENMKTLVTGTNNLAGGITTMDQCIYKFEKATACGLPAALEAASTHPANVLGENDRGHFGIGAHADVVFLSYDDTGLTVMATVIAGDIVYTAENCHMQKTVVRS